MTVTKEKVSLDVFEKYILPQLTEAHPDKDELQKAITDGYTITDEKGVEVEYTVQKAKPAEGEPEDKGGKAVEDFVKAATEGYKKTTEKLIDTIDRKFKPVDEDVEIKVGDPRFAKDKKLGFKSMSEFARGVRKWYQNGERSDDRLKYISDVVTKAPTNITSEGLGADGGFLLPPEFNSEILRWTFTDESIFERCRKFTTGSNNLTIPRDETTPWGTDGVRAYWTQEATQMTDSKIKIGQSSLTLHKLTCLVPVTDEQIQDSFSGLGAYLTELGGSRIRWKLDEAIVNGTGAGQPLGFSNSGALYATDKSSSQTATTFNLTNVGDMISHIPGDSYGNLLWLIHPSVFSQLFTMTNGYQSLYVAPGQLEEKGPKIGRLAGIPLLISQHCQTLGAQGDVYLVDLSKYIALTKGDGIQTDMSIHLYFDYNISTFRFVFRAAGEPWPKAAYISKNGSFYTSPFVALKVRA